MELNKMTACELKKLIAERKCSVDEINAAVRRCIFENEPQTKAYITICERRGNTDSSSPLYGIPIAVKDNIAVNGMPMTCASRMLENFAPPYDATAVKRLLDSGAFLTGKTNLDEFAMGSATDTSYFYPTLNPLDKNYSPGGSSGGSAAAVAYFGAAAALGSDTGGSVRQPASLCGCVGFKPTYGAVSRYGLTAFASSLDHIGIISRTVSDAALIFENISGADKMDATSVTLPHFDMECLKSDIPGLKIALPKEYFDCSDDDVCTAVTNAVKLLEKAGATVDHISLPETKHGVSAYYIISSAEASSNLSRYDGVRYGFRADNCHDLKALYERSRSESFGSEVKRRIMLGTFVLSSGYYESYYKRAVLMRHRIAAEFDEVFKKYDVIISPVYPHSGILTKGAKKHDISIYSDDICTVGASLAGIPAISVPCGKGANGMPVGMQIMAAKYNDASVLHTAALFERISSGGDIIA